MIVVSISTTDIMVDGHAGYAFDVPPDLEYHQTKYVEHTTDEILQKLIERYENLKTPDAPFRNNYHEYVLKRLLRMASEEGYDSIGWTPADIQAERWSDDYMEGYRIEYDQDIPKFLRKYGKKWGATVGTARTTEGYDVWSMDITDSMKQSVLYEGQVMYSDRINVDSELSRYNLEGKWNDYIGVQKEVINTLRKEGYFNVGSVVNKDSGMIIRITSKGIRETIGSGNRFQTLPKKLKIYKVSTIRSLPRLIETGYIIEDEVGNSHSENGYKYAYIGNSINIDGEDVGVRISIKKKIGTNHFWIHNIDEYKKDSELLSPSRKTVFKETQSLSNSLTQDDERVNLIFSDRV